MKVIWSRRALLDVEHIRDYIAQDSPAYAQPFVERLLHATRHLPQFPHSARAMPEADNIRIREVIYQGYRIIYRLCSDAIEIVMVVHGSRNLAGQENKPWEEG
ncbi:MAG: type II toxin-antitoxin system RelE/ParE family toxin [Nitrospirota bacterium]